ncbi:MAG: DNA alkylation repair protein [Erysipelotrichaceae bacterium]|nr:DNA alkylation repair protein [Erysipelotrichaceae bacterium]
MMNKIHQHLLSLQDQKYRDFNAKIITQKHYPMIGVRLPEIRKYAKELIKENQLPDFENSYYEEVLLHGMCIGRYKCDFKEKIKLIESFLPLINDWSICDSFVSSLKDINKHKDEYLPYIRKYIKTSKEFYQRYGFVVLLNYYKEEKYLEEIFKLIKITKYNGYYSQMASAWLLSYMFMYFYDETIDFVGNNKIDEFVLLKGIQKAIDSYRLSDKQKDELRKLRNAYRQGK